MTPRDDDQLLERLGAALAPPAAEPSAAEVAALHRMVAGHHDAVATVTMRRRGGLGWRVGLVAAAAMVLMVALVARPDTTGESAELARARTALQELQQAIGSSDRDAVAVALAASERRVAALDAADRAEVQPEAGRLHEQARALLAVPTTSVPPPPPVTSTTTIPPPPPQTPTTVDDKGGDRDRSGSNSGKG